MPVTTHWDEHHDNIMVWRFDGSWGWEDYYSCRDEVNREIASKPHTVHIIVDMRTSSTLPNSIMTHGQSAVNQSPENLGMTVIVGVNTLLRAFYSMFSRLYTSLLAKNQVDMKMVATIDEAYALIEAYKDEPAT